MSEKQRILMNLEAAIERTDMDANEKYLVSWSELEPGPAAEDSLLFAKRF